MKVQNTTTLTTRISRPLNGRRDPDRGLSFGVALLGIVCVVGVFGLLALLFHAG